MNSVCPACPTAAAPEPVETHHDPIGGKTYRLFRCRGCGVVFTEPREPVGAEWYEKSAPIRHLEARPAPESDWRYRRFFAAPPPPGFLLDVGCGDGRFLKLAKARGFKAAGFDFEARMIALAKANGIDDVQSTEFSAYCRGRKADEFDCVTLFDVLEHTPEPAWFMGELRRLLKPGGHVAITFPNAQRPLPWGREDHDYPPHHFTRWTPRAIRDFLERSGFKIVRQESGTLKVRYLADHFFFFLVMPLVLGAARRLLFGRGSGGTITELYAAQGVEPGAKGSGGGVRGILSDKVMRQRLVNAFKAACYLLIMPLAAGMTLYYRMTSSERGDCLFTLARLERK
ncbi:MAG: class I SAM-dependent methyltransferase [Elusimicrobia bacterium]|nr:class I SAM-dependent methyltransferase [Elusimicrobiota bacterium]